MRQLILVICILCGCLFSVNVCAQCPQYLTKQELQEKQRQFIVERVGLTKQESDSFFPLYFELQTKKKELNDKRWLLLQKGRKEGLTEADYASLVDGLNDISISLDSLDSIYLAKYRKVLSNEKIYKMMRAEVRFHRHMLREVEEKRCRNINMHRD